MKRLPVLPLVSISYIESTTAIAPWSEVYCSLRTMVIPPRWYLLI